MFAGIAPFSIVIAKNSSAKKVYSNEINREANKYSRLNVELNHVKNKVEMVNGDIKKVAKKLAGEKKKMDVIVMPRPQLKESFLEQAFMLSKRGTRVYYYDFCKVEDIDKVIDKIKKEAKENNWFLFNPEEYERYDMREPVLKTKDCDAKEIAKVCGKIYTIFLTPKYVWARLKTVKNYQDFKFNFRGVKAVFGHLKDFYK